MINFPLNLIPRTYLRITAFRRSPMGLSSALHTHPHRAVTVHQLWDCLCAGQASLCLCTNEVPIRTFTHGEPFGFRSVPTNTTNVTVSTRERSRKLFRLQCLIHAWCRYILATLSRFFFSSMSKIKETYFKNFVYRKSIRKNWNFNNFCVTYFLKFDVKINRKNTKYFFLKI